MSGPRHEPWYKPRADEDADEELVNWLGGGGRGNPPKPPEKSGSGCFRIAAPVVVALVALLVALLA